MTVDLARELQFNLGEVVVRPSTREVLSPQRSEIVEPRVMQVLVMLAGRRGEVVSRDELIAACWRGRAVGEDAIHQCIGKVRRVAQTHGGFRIRTVSRVGYRLEVDRPEGDAAKPLLAVLAFDNLCPDPEMTYLAYGISEEILQTVASGADVKVIGRASSFQFHGADKAAANVAAALKATHVLDGSVRREGSTVRIAANLIECARETTLWSGRYDRDLDEIFALQDEISRSIVDALRLRLLPRGRTAIERRGTTNAEAHTLYLIARGHYLAGNNEGRRRCEAMVRLCERAVALDPRYAQAWALMATGQDILHYLHKMPDDGLSAAERALSLDPSSAEALAVRATYFIHNGRYAEADADLEVAFGLDPQSYKVNYATGSLRYFQRRWTQARFHLERAVEARQGDFDSVAGLVWACALLGDAEATKAAARLSLSRAERALDRDDAQAGAIAYGAEALAALGRGQQARDWATQALLIEPDNLVARYNLACAMCFHLKDFELALEIIAPALETCAAGLLRTAKVDGAFDPLRDDIRFVRMIAAAEQRLGVQNG